MLELDYRLAPSVDPSAGLSLATASEAALRYEAFLGDIVLRTDECDLSTAWGIVPVLDFALAMQVIVDRLEVTSDGAELFEFTESEAIISFRRRGTAVAVEASYRDCIATVSYEDLRTATSDLLTRMVGSLTQEHPDLRRNPLVTAIFG